MKMDKMKWVKYIGGAVGGIIAGVILMVGGTQIVYPAISQLVGLSVAQSSTIWNSVVDAAKGDALSSGILGQSPYLWNGVSFDRQRGSITNGALVDIRGVITAADGTANPTTLNPLQSFPEIFNGTTWDRVRSASTANNTAATSLGAQYVVPLSTFNKTNTVSIAATAATTSQAAGGGTVRNVATTVSMCFHDSVINTVGRIVNLRDGASGAGTVLQSWILDNGGTAGGAHCFGESGLNITGSANTQMTLEFAAAPAATASETVNLTGYATP